MVITTNTIDISTSQGNKGFAGKKHSEETKLAISKKLKGVKRKKKLSCDEIEEIKKRKANGETVTSLAKSYGVSRKTIYGYLKE